ncbi:cardiolipin synthase [Anaerotruncus rubiinfantis]|jgi:cardiolipin synthase|uniref:cardiolipin synthase n=1 Tax=Anaerotruncus rubiinfantis TaxID=1720200 RepID=UPI0018973A11|nr:cardiolipin synthase [Anaerotruncus rubiinfantis]
MKNKKKLHIKSVFSFLFSKVVIVALLILVQGGVLLAAIIWLSEYFAAVYAVLLTLSIGIVVWLISKDENPSYKLAWVILLMSFPIFGGFFYLMFGNKTLPKLLTQRIERAEQDTRRGFTAPESYMDELQGVCPRFTTIPNFLRNTTGLPLWRGTQAEYFPLGEHMWKRMLEELPKAKKFIFMEYFILEEGEMWDPILEILTQKAAEGVDVRFMYDDIGSIQTISSRYPGRLRARGIKCVLFNPFRPHLNSMMNYRDHRKITVIDGNVGFCGGINLADEYINTYEKHGHWKDTGVMLKGDAVWNLTSMFLSLWNFSVPTDDDYMRFRPTLSCDSDGFVQPFGDSPLDRINVSEETYMQIINRANRYVYITTPYLILDNEMVTALQSAARSGVDVRIITPHVPDKWFVHETTQSFYQPLLDAGVRIYEYTPGFVHAKMYVADDEIAIVGTANMDYRSFYLHFECGVCFYNARVIADVRDDILQTLTVCQEIPKNYLRHVPVLRRIMRAFLRLFSPMM